MSAQDNDAPQAVEPDKDVDKVKDPFLSRIRDETARAKTGKTWQEWYRTLDSWNATEKTHNATARYLREFHSVTTWWSNAITARYRWVRGLKEQAQAQGRGKDTPGKQQGKHGSH